MGIKLNRWQRLGIVISFFWVVSVLTYSFYELKTATPSTNPYFVHFVPGKTIDSKEYTTISGEKIKGIVWDEPSFKVGGILWTIAIPLIFIWLIVPMSAGVFRWVQAGFRKNNT
jgi:hypothetical protein